MVLYGLAIQELVPVSSCRVAEATKLLENIFRSVNIALVNELKLVYGAMDIDIWEVIEAAKTKPFGYMPFYPGPGLGGHCIPIDPFYLTWVARRHGLSTRFIELAGDVNTAMPTYVVNRIGDALNDAGRPVKGSKVAILGMAYKKNIDDVRESPGLDIMHLLMQRGAIVSYSDPFIPSLRIEDHRLENQDMLSSCAAADCVVVVTDHTDVDYAKAIEVSKLIVDTRNALKKFKSEKIVTL